MPLQDIIIDSIRSKGPISFRDFMETALYYPGHGNYTSPGDKIGKGGDYYTSPCLGNLFGQMIAKQIEEVWELLNRKPFSIVEYGAGQGTLCYDILQQLKTNAVLYNQLRYVIIEKSEEMKQRQVKLLKDKVEWYDDIAFVGNFNGCILANEVLDNFAVHQVLMQDELMEIFVDYDNDFKETLSPAGEKLKNYLSALKIELPNGYRTEINLEATKWIKNIAGALNEGVVLTIDYGYGSKELYGPNRKSGTLLCYHKHTINEAFYRNPGEQDITAHVNFSALKYFGEQSGLTFGGFTNQAQFLLSLGLCDHLTSQVKQVPHQGNLMMIQQLLMGLGKKIKVLALQKGINKPLSGMRLSLPLV